MSNRKTLFILWYRHISSLIYAPPLRHNGQSEGAGTRGKTLDATSGFNCPEGSKFNGLIMVF